MTNGSLRGARCLVAGGAGAVGGLMVDLLSGEGADVWVADLAAAPEGARHVRGDIRVPDERLAAAVRRADLVVLAVPEPVALAAAPAVAHELRPRALLVDTLSVKTRIVPALARARHLEALSLNPLFGPDLGFGGRAVAAVVVHDGPRGRALLDAIRRAGSQVVELGADEHDRVTAVTQALTHAAVLAFGVALDELDIGAEDVGPVATPPHVALLALLARIASGHAETYWDVQAGNPHARSARAALAAGLAAVADAADHGSADDLAVILERVRRLLGAESDAYRRICEELFLTARPPAPEEVVP